MRWNWENLRLVKVEIEKIREDENYESEGEKRGRITATQQVLLKQRYNDLHEIFMQCEGRGREGMETGKWDQG